MSSLVHLLYLVLFLLHILIRLDFKMVVKLLNIASHKNKLQRHSIKSLLLFHILT